MVLEYTNFELNAFQSHITCVFSQNARIFDGDTATLIAILVICPKRCHILQLFNQTNEFKLGEVVLQGTTIINLPKEQQKCIWVGHMNHSFLVSLYNPLSVLQWIVEDRVASWERITRAYTDHIRWDPLRVILWSTS